MFHKNSVELSQTILPSFQFTTLSLKEILKLTKSFCMYWKRYLQLFQKLKNNAIFGEKFASFIGDAVHNLIYSITSDLDIGPGY